MNLSVHCPVSMSVNMSTSVPGCLSYLISKFINTHSFQKWRSVELNEALHLPEINEFIPENFEIEGLSSEQQTPALIKV